MNGRFFAMFLFFLLPGTLILQAQPKIKNVQLAPENKAGLYEKLEVRFQLNLYPNNYDSDVIRVDAEFISPSGKTFIVPGFYYVDYIKLPDFNCGLDIPCESLKTAPYQPYNWMVRFTPNETGEWKLTVRAKDKKGQSRFPKNNYLTFECVPSGRTGFITKNNNRYLKKGNDPVFLVGANVAWYSRSSFGSIPVKETGTNDYKRYIALLSENKANFMRLWINYSAGISLTGREWTNGKMHDFANYNQKDAWQLDQIIHEADQNNVYVVLSLLLQNAFVNSYGVKNWDKNNAYNKKNLPVRSEGIGNPYKIFTDKKAIKKTKDLFRYIIARWGYATNLVAWELWNEVEQIEKIWKKEGVNPPPNYYESVILWHQQMARFIQKTDPFDHLITTSGPARYEYKGRLFPGIWTPMDLTTSHDYQSYNSITQLKKFETHLLNRAKAFITDPELINKPYMSQEWGVTPGKQLTKNDPKGYAFHNCLWASSMTGAYGAIATWEWDRYLLRQHLFGYLQPVSVFMNSVVDQLDGTTRGYKTHMNGLTVFYATTSSENIFIGWCQDDNYDFSRVKNTRYVKNLRSAKPKPYSKKNSIKIPVTQNKQTYTVRWYDTQTAEMVQQETVNSKGYKIKITIPNSLRTSTFGDGAFIIQAGTKPAFEIKPTTEENPSKTPSKRIKL